MSTQPTLYGFGSALLEAMVNSGQIAKLGGAKLLAAAQASDIVSWQPAYDNIFVLGLVPNYQGTDAASFRFGTVPGVVDSAANYWWRSVFCPAGGALLTDNPNASATLIQLGEATNKSRVFAFHLTNLTGFNKMLKAWNAIGTANAATVGDAMVSLEGQYFNPDVPKAPIQSMQMVTLTKNMGAGAQFAVYGLNSPFA